MQESEAMQKPTAADLSRHLFSWRSPAARIASLYALVSGVWIIGSDALVHTLSPDQKTAELFSIIKGWAFVAVTAMMLWGLIQRLLVQIAASEADLRASEERTRTIYDGVNDAIFIHDAHSGEIHDVNLTACRMFGYRREDFRKLSVKDLSSGVEPFTQERAMELLSRALSENEATAEWHARRRDGRLFWTEVSARPAMIGGQTRLLVTIRDITKRRRATDEVRKLSLAVEQSPVSIVITDPRGDIEYVNPATCRLTGYTASEIIGRNPRLFKTEHTTAEEYRNIWETIASGGEWHGEFHNRKKNGELYWESASISPITDQNGKITHYLAVKEDITARKSAEEKLIRQEALLEAAGDIAHVGGWEFDPVSSVGSWSTEVARIHDLDPSYQISPERGLEFYPGESRKKIEAAVAAAVNEAKPYDLELEFISATGRRRWVRTIGRPIVENGRVVLVRGALQDITARKEAERALQESEAHYRSLFENMLNGFAFCRMEYKDGLPVDFTFLRVNAAFSSLTGLADAEGKMLTEAIPGILYTDSAFLEVFADIVRTGGSSRFETHVQALDMWLSIAVYSPMQDHFVAVFDVITERKRAEQELKESRLQLRALLDRLRKTREQERTRLSREVHDVLGQLLTGIKMDLSWIERRAARIDELELRDAMVDKISGTTELTDMMLESVQKIARDLRPSLLDNLGLPSALQAEARQFSDRTGISCVISDLPAPDELSPDCATEVFRIFQEILTNIARHSRATQVRISLTRGAGGVKLVVADNGCGISPDALKDPDSLGLLGMAERAEVLGGSVDIQGVPEAGTRVTLTIPDGVA